MTYFQWNHYCKKSSTTYLKLGTWLSGIVYLLSLGVCHFFLFLIHVLNIKKIRCFPDIQIKKDNPNFMAEAACRSGEASGLQRCYRWTWIWRTEWDQENWSVICKIRFIHMTNTWYASDWDQAYRPSYAKKTLYSGPSYPSSPVVYRSEHVRRLPVTWSLVGGFPRVLQFPQPITTKLA